jgi:hypothetical protein
MAAPEYVPVELGRELRSYESPPRKPDPWYPARPGELSGPQPRGELLGYPGPDQGYVLVLARRFEGKLTLADGEREADAIAGCIGVALRRASLFGRAPVVHDLSVAFAVWGFASDAPTELVEARRPLFAEVANPLHYGDQRRIADLVRESALRLGPAEARAQHARDWRSLLNLDEG